MMLEKSILVLGGVKIECKLKMLQIMIDKTFF